MYAVIRSGGKQYRVAPGDVIRVERTPADGGQVIFSDILAVSGSEGQVTRPQGGAQVVGRVLEEGRGDKILVFHFKRKKQYKKLQGHRQGFAEIRISQISFDGKNFDAPALPAKKVKAPKAEQHEEESKQAAPKKSTATKKTAAKKAPAKKTAAKKTTKKK